jgi:general stress protein 26
MGKTTEELDTEVTPRKKIEDLYELVDGIGTAMMTTRRPDGVLVTRPMATQKRRPGMDFWFVTDVETSKIDELEADPHVSLAYFDTKTWEWVSVSGTARIATDRALIRALHEPDWKAWFEDEGGERNGGPDDPRLAILIVDASSVVYGKKNKPKPLALFEIAKGLVTGEQPDVQDVRRVDETELATTTVEKKKWRAKKK